MKYILNILKFIIIILGTLVLLYVLIGAIVGIFNDKDFCLDTGVCKEGLGLNTEKGYIIINEETCKENDGIWDSKYRCCKFK